MSGRPDVKPHVQRHLQQRGVDPKKVPDGVLAALNDCSEAELKAMERVGASMESENVDASLRISMVH
jgi:hypothetical protein